MRLQTVLYKYRDTQGRGRSSGVERYLAKVNVVSSNLIARSKTFHYIIVMNIVSKDLDNVRFWEKFKLAFPNFKSNNRGLGLIRYHL